MSTLITSPDAPSSAGGGLLAADERRGLRQRVRARPLGVVAAGYLALLVVVAITANWIAPQAPDAQDLTHTLAGPSAQHWLGTDRLGRDVLSRMIVGSRITLLDAAEAIVVFAVLGITLGLAAGYLGGRTDRLISRFGDLLLALPGIIVLLMVVALFPGEDAVTMAVLGLLSSPSLMRVVRGVTLAVRQELYVKAARLSGLTAPQIMRRHILPRLTGPIAVQLSLGAAAAILIQSGLSFLGLAAPETQGPTWGNMIGEASNVISQDGWLLVPTGGIVAITALMLALLGDALREAALDRTTAYTPARRSQRDAHRGSLGETREDRPATSQNTPLLSVRGLSIAFATGQEDLTVVRDVSFDLAVGQSLGIIGESGSGKTLIARSVLGLLPAGARIASGSVVFDGHEVSTLTERGLAGLRGSRIALISQDPMAGLDPSFTVASQLTEVIRRHAPMRRNQALDRARELLEMVNLPEPDQVLRCYPHELSGGMAQRIALALALAGEPALLIADEPTTALDVTVQAEILTLLRDLQQRLGMAVILVTHDWSVLARLCDRVLVMYAGEAVEIASVDQLYLAPRHPYTEGLLSADLHLALVGEDLVTIPGTVPLPAAWPPGCHFQPRCPYATAACAAGPIPLFQLSADEEDEERVTRCIHSEKLVTP